MKLFAHCNSSNLDEAVDTLRQYGGRAAINGGGTDLLGKMKDDILPIYPEAIVNLKSIPGLDYIKEQDDVLKIGAITRLEDIANEPGIKKNYKALHQAAHHCASPHIREMGTIGGNICQDIRCWYYRRANNRFPCLRKGGGRCYAIEGENRYHSIFGGTVAEGCYAVHPSDTAPALIALSANVKTTKRTVKAEDFFYVDVSRTTILDYDEIVTEIEIPRPMGQTCFLKFALRKSIDFPIVNCAAAVRKDNDVVVNSRICLNSVYPVPYRATKAEETIVGKALTEENVNAAVEAVIADAQPMKYNAYMVLAAKEILRRVLLSCQ